MPPRRAKTTSKQLKTKVEVLDADKLRKRDPHAALAIVDRVLADHPDDSQAHYLRGQILAFDLHRPADGLASLERAYDDVVRNSYFVPGAHRAFATCLAELGEHRRAIAVLDGCLATYPDELNAWIDRASAKQELGDIAGAIADLDEVLARSSDHTLALYNRACFLALAGKPDESLDTLQRLFVLEPTDRDAARDDDDFSALRDNPRFVELVG